jgi:hypothetical protein
LQAQPIFLLQAVNVRKWVIACDAVNDLYYFIAADTDLNASFLQNEQLSV